MKDPFQRDASPYDVLGVTRGATAEEVDRAFKEGLIKRLNVQKLTAAKQALAQPAQRAMVDLFQYDPAVVQGLTPSPGNDGTAFQPPRRWQTARAWENALKARFPDLSLAHSLAVLWYWSGIHEEENPGTASALGLTAQGLWEHAIACWAMLIANDGFWEKFPAETREGLKTRVVETIRAKLQDLEQPYRDRGDHAGAQIYQDLELTLDTELRTARQLASTRLRSETGAIACGPLMLQHIGALSAVRAQVQKAIETAPENAALRTLHDALSPYAAIAELIRKLDPKSAVEALDRLPPKERDSREVQRLRAEAHRVLANQQASLDQFEEATGNWERALKLAPELEPTIRADVESFCHVRAAALQRSKPAQAIQLLETATRLVHSDKLRLTLAEILTQRGIETINDVQKTAGPENTPAVIAGIERGLRDLERAAALGSHRAATNVEVARAMVGRARWLSKGARSADFNRLPPAQRRRFVDALEMGGSPSPLLEAKEPRGLGGWIGLAIMGLVTFFLSARVGFGELNELLYHGFAGLVFSTGCLFLVSIGVLGAWREKLLRESYPYPRGRYIFPLEYVDARGQALRIIPMRDVQNFEGLHHHRNGVYTHTELTFRFNDENSRSITEKFRIAGKEEADLCLKRLQASRQQESDAVATGNFDVIRSLALFVDSP